MPCRREHRQAPVTVGNLLYDKIAGFRAGKEANIAGFFGNGLRFSTGSGRSIDGLRTNGGSPSPPYQVRGGLQPSPIKGRGGPSTGSGRAGGCHPHPRIKYGAGSNPLPSREWGSFDGLRTNGGSPSPPYQVRGRLQPSPIKGDGAGCAQTIGLKVLRDWLPIWSARDSLFAKEITTP